MNGFEECRKVIENPFSTALPAEQKGKKDGEEKGKKKA